MSSAGADAAAGADLLAFLQKYARELDEQAGAPDSEIHAKIALLQKTLNERDSAVKTTLEKMENGGIGEVLQQVHTWEHQAAAAERSLQRDLQDPAVMSLLSAAGPLLGAHFRLPEGEEDEEEGEQDDEEDNRGGGGGGREGRVEQGVGGSGVGGGGGGSESEQQTPPKRGDRAEDLFGPVKDLRLE